MRAAPLLALSCLLLGLATCSPFKAQQIDAGLDGPAVHDASKPPDQHADSQDAAADLPLQVPLDFVCPGLWTESDRAEGQCKLRQVFLVESDVLEPQGVSLAVSPAGQIGILYDFALWADEGELHLALLSVAVPAVERIVKIQDGSFTRFGSSDLISGADGTFHFAYTLVSDHTRELIYRRLESGELTVPETLAHTFPPSGSAAIAINAAHEVMVAYHNPVTARFESRLRFASGEWQEPRLIHGNAGLGDMPAAQLDLKATPDQIFHVGYLYWNTMNYTTPRYSSFAGQLWLDPTLLEDNLQQEVLLGWSPSLAIRGDQRTAVYFELSTSNAALHLASWRSTLTKPAVSQIEKSILQVDSPRSYWVASAIDRHGLLHLALLTPSVAGQTLSYKRQYLSGGEKIWLEDQVAFELGDSAFSKVVDIFVDEQDRPHIAYFDQSSAQIYYATRLDRP